MHDIQNLLINLQKEADSHKNDIFNYALPQSWNLYGFSKTRVLRNKQIIVNPYDFYLYSFSHIFLNDQGELKKALPLINQNWLKKASIYSLHIRSATAWDHDRDDSLERNIYHLKDTGTFLKAILLLPIYKRMGINTILLHQPFALGKTMGVHPYAHKECCMDFRSIAEELKDPLLPQMSAMQQCRTFIEACHHLGMRVILEYCPGELSIDNFYSKTHPEWFYWIKKDAVPQYHAPSCNTLPQNTIPFTYTLKEFYRSEDVQQHIAQFVSIQEKEENRELAMAFSDQINAGLPANPDATYFRFYEDLPSYVAKDLKKAAIPYLTQDIIRSDLHPAKKPIQSLWDELANNILWYQDEFAIDGIYLAKPYLLPEKLQKDLSKHAKRHKKAFIMIAEDTVKENSAAWKRKGYDMISGNSAYEETMIQEYKFHAFAYQLKGNECPMLAASEFYDSRRCSSLPNGKLLTNMLSIMNQFLPNGVPMYMNGIETYDVQPMQLSEYGDQKYVLSLPKEDPRYRKQAYVDPYHFMYNTYEINDFITLMEKTSRIRNAYLEAIIHPEKCIPVWFDSPQDAGIGFTFFLETKALSVIANTNIEQNVALHIHTDNLFKELPFTYQKVLQMYSSHDPYIQDVFLDDRNNLPLSFQPGEVKFIEWIA